MPDSAQTEPPRLVLREEDMLLRLLRLAQRQLQTHPATARTIVQALVTEGRRFAATPAGERWKTNLAVSDLVQRGRLIWQAYGLDALLDGQPQLLPTDWLELITTALAEAELEIVLATLMQERGGHGTIDTL